MQLDYIRRSWGNLPATINRAWTPADFDPFVYNVPQDPKLPGGGGYALTFYDVKPAKFQSIDNYLTFADNVGGALNTFNGVDFTVNARLREVTFQGGIQHGERRRRLVRRGQESPGDLHLRALGRHRRVPRHVPRRRRAMAAVLLPSRVGMEHEPERRWRSYTVPKIDMLVSGTFRSLPYPGNEFPSVQSQSIGGQATALFLGIPGVDSTNLGRPLASGIPVEFLNIVKPGAVYGDRLNAVDLRFGKILRYGSDQDARQPRHLQPVQLEHAAGVQPDLRADVSQPVVDHVGAVLQDRRAVRLLIGRS